MGRKCALGRRGQGPIGGGEEWKAVCCQFRVKKGFSSLAFGEKTIGCSEIAPSSH